MAIRSRNIGGMKEHPLATRRVPDDYDALVAAIAAEERWLATPPDGAAPFDRVAHTLYLERLKRRRRDYDAAMDERARDLRDAEAIELHAAHVAQRDAELYGGA